MKLELVTVAALAASVSAIPIRIITLAGPAPHLPPFDVAHNLPPSGHRHGDGDEGVMRILPHPAHPCGKMGGGGRQSSSPFSDLFERLGLVKPSHRDHGHRYNHEYVGDHGQFMDSAVFVPDHKHPHGGGEKHDGNMLIEGWKHHVEEMFGGAKKILPVMESGEVRLLPFMNDEEEDGRHHRHGHGIQGQAQGQGRGKHLRPHGEHHWRHKASSFGSRLHRAMLHLSPTEAITLAFVLGAGIGSIMHLIFMLFLISIRRIRGGRSPRCLARQAARRERREARKAAKAAKRAAKAGGVGQVSLEGEENEEVLPSYADGEGDRLVEKA